MLMMMTIPCMSVFLMFETTSWCICMSGTNHKNHLVGIGPTAILI